MLNPHTTKLLYLNIAKLDDETMDEELYKFTCEDLKNGKEYEQIYTMTELKNQCEMLKVYPKIFLSLINDQIPEITFIEACANISWFMDIKFIGKEAINITVKRKNNKELSKEIIELQQSNKLLRNEVKMLKDDMSYVKEILLKCVNISEIVIHPELIKIFIDSGMNIINHHNIDSAVKSIFTTCFYGENLDILKKNEYVFIKELIKYGYSSITSLNIKSEELGCQWKYEPTTISILLRFVLQQIQITSENGFLVFKMIIELINPSSTQLNIKYSNCGTILDCCKNRIKEEEKQVFHHSCFPDYYKSKSESFNLIKIHMSKIIKYLESLGAI